LTLTFTRPQLIDDCSLHRCIRINRYQRDKVISFVPPDGYFTLMSYRVRGVDQLPIQIKPSITYKSGTGKISIMVTSKFKNDKPVTDIVLNIPLPKAMKSSTLSANVGVLKQDQLTKICKWEIGRMRDEKTPLLEGVITLPPDYVPDESPVITAEFIVKLYCSSGLKVDGLAIKGVKYKPFKGVRSVTQAGRFQVRC